MKNSPTVTIITAAYNCISYFRNAFNAVENQTFKDFEWIIVDDGSTDGTTELLEELARDNSFIKLFKLEKNSGSSAARNFALDKAQGKYISFLDSDDVIDKNFLEEQTKFIKDHGPIVSGYYRIKSEKKEKLFEIPEKITFKENLKLNYLSPLTTMFERETFKNVRFDPLFDRQEDYIFWMDMLKTGVTCYTNKKLLGTYNIHKGSKNFRKIHLVKYNYRIYHKVFGFTFIHALFCVVRWGINGLVKYRGLL